MADRAAVGSLQAAVREFAQNGIWDRFYEGRFDIRSVINSSAEGAAWVSAFILAAVPLVVAVDYGGVLWWSQYVLSLVVGLAMALAIPAVFSRENPGRLAQHTLLLPMVLWLGYSLFQTVPLPGQLVEWLSRGSAEAFGQWTAPFVGTPASRFPISLSSEQSRHQLALMALASGVVWAGTQVFFSRSRITMGLSVIAIGASVHAIFGLVRLLVPESIFWEATSAANGFGTFINRNNAALLLNFGFASCLGLLAWRLTALTGMEVDDPSFELSDLIALASDRASMVGVIGIGCCAAGLLVCGSRGGLVAALCGFCLALGWIRQKQGARFLAALLAILVVSATVLVVPLDFELTSLLRLDDSSSKQGILQDSRWSHWQDGWTAAMAHFPAGSGLGTYGYAYLPHQAQSSNAWYRHADNLWLELLTEQGLVGIGLVVAVVFLVGRGLALIGTSADPVDHGLRVAGWYVMGAVVVSQCFDFGVLMPANALMVALFPSIVLARSIAIGGKQQRIRFRSQSQLGANLVVAVGMVLIVVASAVQLRSDAEVDYLGRSVDASISAIAGNMSELDSLHDQISSHPRSESSSILLKSLMRLNYQRGRLDDVVSANLALLSEVQQAYQQTSLSNRRRDDNPFASREVSHYYRSSLAASEESLRRQPIDLVPLTWQTYLDFVHNDSERTFASLRRIKQIHSRHPETLVKIGQLAADSQRYELAAEFWSSAITGSVAVTREVLAKWRESPKVSLLNAIPNSPKARRIAVGELLKNTSEESTEFLSDSLSQIKCDQCETLAEGADCSELAGDLRHALELPEQALKYYADAIAMTPANGNLHWKYVSRLQELGHRDQALVAARRARQLLPQDQRFSRAIDQMAQQDRMSPSTGKP